MYLAWGGAPAQNFVRTGLRKKKGCRTGSIAKIVKRVEVKVKIDICGKLGTWRCLFCKRGDNYKNCKSNRWDMVIRGP